MVRQLAWEVLRSGSPTPLREVDLAAAEVGLDARDRGLLRSIVGAEVRHRGTLRALVAHFARGNPKAGIRMHLHVALAQLFYLDRVPPRAILSEAGDATRRTLGPSKVAYVNGVLRAIQRARRQGHSGDPRRDLPGSAWHFEEPLLRDPATHPFLWAEDALSIPPALMKRWHKHYGRERAEALGHYFMTEPALSLRVVHGQREEVAAELEAVVAAAAEQAPEAASEDTSAPEPLVWTPGSHPAILVVRAGDLGALFASPAFAEGRVTVQGESALKAAELVEARADERILDLCAAPGGKTAVLAGAGAKVTAVDVSEAKLRRLGETLERLAVAEQVELVESDGSAAVTASDFDAVLVDAPCSNTGVLGARPGARWRFGPSSQAELRSLQARLFAEGAERVRPGGRLVWSTCSLESDENGQQVKRFLEQHPGWTLEVEHQSLPGSGVGEPIDGGFAARLRKPG